jgi:hypothetical protein
MRSRLAAILLTLILATTVISQAGSVHAWSTVQEYVKDPAAIPRFKNYTTPTIEPGSSGTLSFVIENRYNNATEQTVLTIELYELGTIKYSKLIGDVKNPPRIGESGNMQRLVMTLNRVESNKPLVKEFTIRTSSDTEEGTYFVRFNLTFNFNGTKYTMLSRGYYSDADWEFATKNPGGDESNINMSYLYIHYNSIAIIPDTAFSVKSPIPMWPFYLLVALTIMFAALAVVFYLQEEYNKFPRLEKALQKWTGKFYQRRRLLKKRSGKRGSKV